MATSLSTVYLAFDINHASDVGSGYIFSAQTAELLLHIIEPIQIGYGAVVNISASPATAMQLLSFTDTLLSGSDPLGARMG